MPETFSYKITDVPDLDQRWDALPNDGAMYCVPASAMNWMYYLAQHGRPGAVIPPPNDPGPPLILANLTFMAGYMDTDPIDGTSGDGAFEGLVDYLDDRHVPTLVVTGHAREDGITLGTLESVVLLGGLVTVTRGRYKKVGGRFDRTGGHVMSLIGIERNDGAADLVVRDPADDSANLHTQSARVRTPAQVKAETRNIEGQTVQILRWGTGTDPYCFLDGWMAIVPMFALTNPTAKVVVRHRADLRSGSVATKKFRFPSTPSWPTWRSTRPCPARP